MNKDLRERIKKIKKGEVPEGYKKTAIGILPNEWGMEKIGKYYPQIRNGFVGIATPHYVKKGIKYLQGNNIKKGRIITKGITHITEEFHKKQHKSALKVNDIVMVQSGHVGECAVINGELENSNCHALIVMSPKENVDSYYYSYYFNSTYGEKSFFRIKIGNTIEHILASDMKEFKVPVPNWKEQQKIATVLSTWDKAIELKEKQIQHKKEQKRGLMQKLLTGEVRLPGFHGEWIKARLGDLFDRITRKNTNGNNNVLTISARKGLINQEDFFTKTVASSILDNYTLLNKGEFAYNKSYSNGYPMGAIKRLNNYENGVVTTLYICFSLKKNYSASSDFFEQYFESGLLNSELTQIAQEGGRAHGLLNVSTKDFFQLPIKVPENVEQVAIADILCTADREIDLHEKELENLKFQKKGLMQLLLTGIVRVKV